MNINELKKEVEEIKQDLYFLSLLVCKKGLRTADENSRENQLLLFNNTEAFNRVYYARKKELAANNFWIRLFNLDEIVGHFKNIKQNTKVRNKREVESLSRKIRSLSTKLYCLNKMGNFSYNQNEYNVLDLLAQSSEKNKLIDIIIDNRNNNMFFAIIALIKHDTASFKNLIGLIEQRCRERKIAISRTVNEIKDYYNANKHNYNIPEVEELLISGIEEQKIVDLIQGQNNLATRSISPSLYFDKEKETHCYCSALAYKNKLFSAGRVLYQFEVNSPTNEEVVIANTTDIILERVINAKEELLRFINIPEFKAVAADFILFLESIGYIESALDKEIATILYKKTPLVDKGFMKQMLESHQTNHNPIGVSKQRLVLIDHLKALSEHLLDAAPARSQVQESIPVNVQYTFKREN